MQTSIYAQKYPDQVKREMRGLIRVKTLLGQFELDSKGTIDEKGIVKEALVYSVQEWVTDPSNPLTNVLSSCSHVNGVYKRPFFLEQRATLEMLLVVKYNPLRTCSISNSS